MRVFSSFGAPSNASMKIQSHPQLDDNNSSPMKSFAVRKRAVSITQLEELTDGFIPPASHQPEDAAFGNTHHRANEQPAAAAAVAPAASARQPQGNVSGTGALLGDVGIMDGGNDNCSSSSSNNSNCNMHGSKHVHKNMRSN